MPDKLEKSASFLDFSARERGLLDNEKGEGTQGKNNYVNAEFCPN